MSFNKFSTSESASPGKKKEKPAENTSAPEAPKQSDSTPSITNPEPAQS